jgi:protein SCO1/2
LAWSVFFLVLACQQAEARQMGGPAHGIANETPAELKSVTIDQKIGESVNLDLEFSNEAGERVSLRSFTQGGRPLLLSLAYYTCPGICNVHLNGVTEALKKLPPSSNDIYRYVVVSIDPRETPAVAQQKKQNYLNHIGRPDLKETMHFLTSREEDVRALAASVGFNYHWNEEQQEYAHGSAAIVVTPEGKIARYLPGIVFDPQTIRLSMLEASRGQLGSLVDQVMLYCFRWDPSAGRFTLAAFNVMRLAAGLMVVALTILLVPYWWRQRRQAVY